MKAIVVYESHWGNTAAVARAIAEGIGPDARVLSTAEATGDVHQPGDARVLASP
jgi:flavodoxin